MKKQIYLKLSIAALSVVSQVACMPAFLEKYRKPQSEVEASAPTDATAAAAPAKGTRRARSVTPTISQIGESTFRLLMSYDKVWETSVDVLLHNYNLQIVDRASGILTTEWDSYYLDGKVNRNKVSLRLKRSGPNTVDLIVHNNVEVLSRTEGGVSEVWLPSDRFKPEIGRIVQNLAIATGQPKPQLSADLTPTGAVPASATTAPAAR